MKEQRKLDGFEQRLLAQLKGMVAERGAAEEAPRVEAAAPSPSPSPRRRNVPRLAFAAVAVVAAAAAAMLVNAGGDDGSKAFAVESQDGGGTTIKVFSPEDAPGLEAALADAGVRSEITWLPAGMTCRGDRYTPSTVENAMGGRSGGFSVAGPGPAMTIGLMSGEQYRELWRQYRAGEISADELHASTGNITIDPTAFGPDQSVVISGAPGPSPDLGVVVNGATGPFDVDPEGGYEASFGIAEGPVAPCQPVSVEDGGTLGKMLRVYEAEAAKAAGK